MSAMDTIAITIIVAVAILAAPSYARPPREWCVASAGTDGASATALQGPTSFVQPGTLHFRSYRPRTSDIRTSDVVGSEVRNLRNEKVGLIVDLVLGNNRIVSGFIINVEGFLGGGNRNVAVTASSILLLKRDGRLDRALIDVTRETLEKAEPIVFPAAKSPGVRVSDTPRSNKFKASKY